MTKYTVLRRFQINADWGPWYYEDNDGALLTEPGPDIVTFDHREAAEYMATRIRARDAGVQARVVEVDARD